MESSRKLLLWRIDSLLPLSSYTPPQTIHCLPTSIQDPFNRPILILRITQIQIQDPHDQHHFRDLFIPTLEMLRLLLREVNREREREDKAPALQFVMLLDLEGVSIQSIVSLEVLVL